MPSKDVIRLISVDLDIEIQRIINKVHEMFGIKPTIKQATKILAWKARNYNINLTAKKLKEILGGDDE